MAEKQEVIALDVESITMGEMAAAEEWSGKSSSRLLTGAIHQRFLAIFISRLRNAEPAISWQEIANLRVLDAPSSSLRSQAGSPSEKSNDSD